MSSKLLAIQKKLKPILKDEINPFFKSKYADINSVLAELRPILTAEGVVILQPLSHIDGKPALITRVIDSTDGSVLVESITPLLTNDDPQKMGAIITYFRRYALISLFCLESEDDDGNSTAKVAAKPNSAPIDVEKLPKCPHGHKRRYVPAGKNKLGKPHDAFYPCDVNQEQQTPECKKSIVWAEMAEDLAANF